MLVQVKEQVRPYTPVLSHSNSWHNTCSMPCPPLSLGLLVASWGWRCCLGLQVVLGSEPGPGVEEGLLLQLLLLLRLLRQQHRGWSVLMVLWPPIGISSLA